MFNTRRAYPLVLLSLIAALATGATLFLWCALALVAVLIVRPALLEPLVSTFEALTRFIGTLVSGAVLALIFYVFVVPYGFLYRRLQKDLARSFFDPAKDSYFVKASRRYGTEHFENPW